jgi:hypothetical protein
MDSKHFHLYKTQVKIVLACCILHNWILRHGFDEHVPDENTWEPNIRDNGEEDRVLDNATWAAKREAWATQMWQHKGVY